MSREKLPSSKSFTGEWISERGLEDANLGSSAGSSSKIAWRISLKKMIDK
jgi:hypothetical protein